MKCPHVTKSELVGDEHGWCVVCLRAEVKDLKARLKAARMTYLGTRNERIASGAEFDEENGEDFDDALARVTDLRVKNWRRP